MIDKYLSRKFTRNYNCFDFVRDIWLDLKGIDLGSQTPESKTEYCDRALKVANTLTKINSPQNPSIVLLMRDKLEPHVGVYYNGKVLHLTVKGAYYLPLCQVSLGYSVTNFYI